MKRIFSLLALTLVLSSFVLAQDNRKIEAEITKLEHEFEEAWVKHDSATIDKLTTSDFIAILNTVIRTKAQAILPLSPNVNYTERTGTLDDLKVRLYGDSTAIVTSHWKEVRKMKSNGNERIIEGLMTSTWVKQGGKWLMATSHSSIITPPPQPAK